LLKGFTRWGLWFQPPIPFTLSHEGDSLDFEAELPLVVLVPLLWDMEDMYSAFSKGPINF